MTVVQNGIITPSHLVKWVTDGVIADAGFFPTTGEMVLGQLLSANFNVTTDQQISIASFVNKFAITRIFATNASVSLTTAVGGFYTTTAKGGTPLVSAAQTYSALTTSAGLLAITLASYATSNAFAMNSNYTGVLLPNTSIYFSLTTGQGVAALGDLYVVGIVLA